MYAQTLDFFLTKKEGTPNPMQHSHSSSYGYQPMRITLININAKNKIQVNYLNEGCCLLI